jgi:hypothetical protein
MFSLQDFSLGDNISQMSKVDSNSQVFTIMMCLQQDSLSQIIDYTIENYNLYSLLNST